MKRLYLSDGSFTLVDDQDFEMLSGYKWCSMAVGYVGTWANGHTQLLHRMLLGNPKTDVDHINGHKRDNRRSNLRLASRSQNAINRPPTKNSTTGYKGVSKCSRGKFQAIIGQNGKSYFLGRFDTAEAAARAYDRAAQERFGSFAWLNNVVDRQAA